MPGKSMITSDDNGSYFVGYPGYPAIALPILRDKLPYDADATAVLRGVAWKDLNIQYGHDYERVLSVLH